MSQQNTLDKTGANKKRKQSVQDTPSSESVEYDHVHSIYSPQPIRDHNNDIAEAGNRAKMRVRLPNRHTFERVYLQAKTAGKTTTVAWDPSHFSSADQNFTSVEKSAGGAGESVTECLVVGLVIGSDPTLHIKPSAGAPGSKVKEDPLFMSEQHQDVLRAVIITSKNKKTKASYYVACKPEQGRCAVRIIDRKSIFFFSEFCFGVYQSTNSGRLDAIQRNALKAATRNKMNDVNEDLDILSRTKSEHLLEELNHHFGQYMNFNHQEHLDVMENHLDLAALDLSFGPYTENYGTATFYCYAMDFTISHARMVMVELKEVYPAMPNIDLDLIVAVRHAVATGPQPSQLPYQALGLFLHLCSRSLHGKDAVDVIAKEVQNKLELVDIVRQFPLQQRADTQA